MVLELDREQRDEEASLIVRDLTDVVDVVDEEGLLVVSV